MQGLHGSPEVALLTHAKTPRHHRHSRNSQTRGGSMTAPPLHRLFAIPNPFAAAANGVRPACRRQGPAFALRFRRGGACPARACPLWRACPPWRATLRVASIRCRISGIARDLISALAVVGPDRFYRAVAVHRTALALVRQARGQLWRQLALLNAALAAEVVLLYDFA